MGTAITSHSSDFISNEMEWFCVILYLQHLVFAAPHPPPPPNSHPTKEKERERERERWAKKQIQAPDKQRNLNAKTINCRIAELRFIEPQKSYTYDTKRSLRFPPVEWW